MQEKLATIIDRFRTGSTSLEEYKAISDFVELVLTIPEYIASVEEEGERISDAWAELGFDTGRESREYNEYRTRKAGILHDLDPIFPLRNLYHVYIALKPEHFTEESFWLFKTFSPDEPFPKASKKEYQKFLDKVYKRVLPFIKKESSQKKAKNLDFDPEESELFIQGKKIRISMKSDKTNAHHILQYLFSHPNKLSETHFYTDINKEFPLDILDQPDSKILWRKYYRACLDINEKVRKQASLERFLIITSGNTGAVKINKAYLK